MQRSRRLAKLEQYFAVDGSMLLAFAISKYKLHLDQI